MKDKLFRRGLLSVIIILFVVISVITSTGFNSDEYIVESCESILSLNMFESAAYICDASTNQLYKYTCHGSILLGNAPSTYNTSFLSGGTWIPSDDYPWWVIENWFNGTVSAIWRINTEGDYLQVTENCGAHLNGLEFDPVTEKLFGCSSDKLYEIDMVTGESTVVGLLPQLLFIMLGINNYGIGYGLDLVTDSLYKINLTDASTELVGSTGQSMNYAQDCSFDHDANPELFYIAAYTTTGCLFICDIETGLCTLVGGFPGGAEMTAFAISYGNENENQDPYADFMYTPLGPYTNETVLFNASASFDPDGNIISYEWDWDNDKIYEGYSTSPLISHSFSSAGEIPITLKVWDDLCGCSTKTDIITIFINYPPDTPEINGPTKGKIGEKYTYCISQILDPDEDSMMIFWDWGDGTNSSWLGAYPSGQEICESHTWNKKDIYVIKVKLKDEHGAESEWGTFEVSIPITRVLYKSNWLDFLERFPIIEDLIYRFG